MIETPRAALLADQVAEVADFFSFGTNDLTQMTFGFSRDDVEGRMMSAYLSQGLLSATRSSTWTPAASESLSAWPSSVARAASGPQDRRLWRARGRPGLDRLLRQGGTRLRQLLALPVCRWRGSRRHMRCSRWTPRRRSKLPHNPAAGSNQTDRTSGRTPAGASRYRPSDGHPRRGRGGVRSATDILALIGEYTPLKRVGRRYVGLCPFHAEKTASFSVNAEEGLYYCFGCQASGDPITFLRNIEGATSSKRWNASLARPG